MNPSTPAPLIGNICVGLAAILFLLPLQNLLADYARKHVNDDQWVAPALTILIPLWLLLLGALLCVTASGGFDWLRLGRPVLYTLTVAATLALSVVSFVFVAFYVRPGFTPRFLYTPGIYLVPLTTMLLVVLSLNPRLAPGIPTQWVRWPWTLVAALSLLMCLTFFGYRAARLGVGGAAALAHRLRHPGPSSADLQAQIATLDPEKNFEDLLHRASWHGSREVRETATARLRSHPKFLERLSSELETGYVEPAVAFLRDATLSPEEKNRLAKPACTAMQRWVNRIPAPNYTTKSHLKKLRRWGDDMFRALAAKFAGAGANFAPVMDDFRERVEPTK